MNGAALLESDGDGALVFTAKVETLDEWTHHEVKLYLDTLADNARSFVMRHLDDGREVDR